MALRVVDLVAIFRNLSAKHGFIGERTEFLGCHLSGAGD